MHSGVCGGIFGISLSFWIVEDLTQNPGRFKYVLGMRRLAFVLGVTLGFGISACGSSSGVSQTSGATAASTAASSSPSSSTAVSEPRTTGIAARTGTLELVFAPTPGQQASPPDLVQAASALRALSDVLRLNATVDVVGESVHVTVSNTSDSDRSDITDSLNLTGIVYLRPVIACAQAPSTTVPEPAAITSTTLIAGASDPTPPQILPTRDGRICQVGPAAATGEVFVANSAVADTVAGGGWGVTVDLKSGAEGEGVWNAIASECFKGTATCPSNQLAIELNGQIQTAPTIMAQKFSGAVQITGDFTERHARALAATLNSGGLPFTLSVTSVVFTP